jgi:hypothetical protein
MKNKIILIVSLIISLSTLSQYSIKPIKTTSPCNDAMLMEITGEWHQLNKISPGFMGLTAAQIQEGTKRLDAIHKLVQGVYHELNGAIVADGYKTFQAEFAKQVRFEKNGSGINEVTVAGKPFPFFFYNCVVYPYFCTGTNEIGNIYPVAGSGGIEINVNGGLSNFLGDWGVQADEGTIKGRPIKMKKTAAKMWKGYELCYPSGPGGPESNEQSGSWCLLVHRKGMLPYIPVTRKQYLDFILNYLPKVFDPIIQGYNDMPVRSLEEQEAEKNRILAKYEKDYGKDPKRLKSAVDYYLSGYKTEQQQRDENKEKTIKDKNDALKRYHDELDNLTKDGSLDSPAIIQGMMIYPKDDVPIFTTEEAGGQMLVTENPKYMRKDLPVYVPQFFLVHWSWQNYPSVIKFGKAINENFPIEKLQEMIDK